MCGSMAYCAMSSLHSSLEGILSSMLSLIQDRNAFPFFHGRQTVTSEAVNCLIVLKHTSGNNKQARRRRSQNPPFPCGSTPCTRVCRTPYRMRIDGLWRRGYSASFLLKVLLNRTLIIKHDE
jgi:hypothetical protein